MKEKIRKLNITTNSIIISKLRDRSSVIKFTVNPNGECYIIVMKRGFKPMIKSDAYFIRWLKTLSPSQKKEIISFIATGVIMLN